jgi:hypothetical protein
MNALFKKLNFKSQEVIYAIDAPESFAPALEEMRAFARVETSLARAKSLPFAIAFAITQKQLDAFAVRVGKLASADEVIWVAYPKGSSKRYQCEFNRDSGWGVFGELGYEPVRMVAVDEDWSALRLRRVENIKTMKRSRAISEAGKKRIAPKG